MSDDRMEDSFTKLAVDMFEYASDYLRASHPCQMCDGRGEIVVKADHYGGKHLEMERDHLCVVCRGRGWRIEETP